MVDIYISALALQADTGGIQGDRSMIFAYYNHPCKKETLTKDKREYKFYIEYNPYLKSQEIPFFF